jgi:hypothetical protein
LFGVTDKGKPGVTRGRKANRSREDREGFS